MRAGTVAWLILLTPFRLLGSTSSALEAIVWDRWLSGQGEISFEPEHICYSRTITVWRAFKTASPAWLLYVVSNVTISIEDPLRPWRDLPSTIVTTPVRISPG